MNTFEDDYDPAHKLLVRSKKKKFQSSKSAFAFEEEEKSKSKVVNRYRHQNTGIRIENDYLMKNEVDWKIADELDELVEELECGGMPGGKQLSIDDFQP